jgi:DegV family protein with EDD domain
MTFRNIRFVTDSTCDLPPELIQTYKIGVVPAFVNYGGQSYADDGLELNREMYYNMMPNMSSHPTTAAPPPALSERIVQETFAGADHLIIVCAPAKLSAIYNSLRLGASSLPPERVTQIDAGTVSMGLGWQVLIGARVATETGSVEQAVKAMERVRQHQKVYAALETMEYLRRSGRVGWAAASVGALLQIKPIISIADGNVPSVARVRTFARATDKLIDLAQAEAPLDKLAILHSNNLDGAEALKQRLNAILPAEVLIINVTPVIGTHIGPKCLGVATVSQAWRE